MHIAGFTGVGQKLVINENHLDAPMSFYKLRAIANNGEEICFERYLGMTVIIVNVASNCGYTAQYGELEALFRARKQKLVILGFPSNQFGGQEPGTDKDIAAFCKANYRVDFPLFRKAKVKGRDKQPVYEWLTNPSLNGWNAQEPTWNFCKYIIDKNGRLQAFCSANVSPLSEEIRAFLQ
jgi:glutathione peroxidase